jgi:hypothetical protein
MTFVCQNTKCNEILDVLAYERGTGYCDDCEFERLTRPGWLKPFLEKLERWKD